MEELKIQQWIDDNIRNFGSGYGYGYGCGYGYDDGCGDGSGYGYGYGYDDGSGYGYGCGYGYGYGSGSGYGYGCGCGDGIGSINGENVFLIDKVQTVITHIRKSVAKGFILESDLSLIPCYIVKGHGYFAHGKTVRDAVKALHDKIFEDMDTEEAIDKFIETFKPNQKYKGSQFFDWHHYLTGSCLMGRESFVNNHNLDLDADYSVEEFIELTKDDYGGEVIRQLKERWENEFCNKKANGRC